MPNAKVLEEKRALVAELTEKMKNASAGVLVDYKGITVADDTKLRRELRAAGVEYAVIKNTMLRFAIDNLGYSELDEQLNGTTALAISPEDPVAAAKILTAYAKKNDKFKIKGGFVDGKPLNTAEVADLAELPPREVLIAKVLGGFNAPISGLVGVTNGLLRGLVAALAAIAEKKEEPAA
ncbi:MAG: 50S ribosomal protein L10 [Clostridiaceae bacterium]|nr:50S ribosomal protein L10 [Clostridiales bacterium]MDD6876830.1 50S ribosomal protein L10 [Clostridiaceae bacterium]MDY3072670.1 50S ribosomal protein L10 [Eubacteriales bacterium]MDY3285525.1 50S ribosomal protein L10 [Eubacteriales bacterium]MDY5015642.1 50S ribosomal protein L10 [Eubacteriales bacterium]